MVDPTKSKEGKEIPRAYQIIQKTLTDRGLKPKTRILDNERSNTRKNNMAEEEEQFHLVPPETTEEMHQRGTYKLGGTIS